MTSAAYRLLAFVVAASLGSQAFGGLSLTPRSELYDGIPAPALHSTGLRMTATATPDGIVTAWASGGSTLHVALVDSSGVARNHTTIAIPYSDYYFYYANLSSASDGVGAVVLVATSDSYIPIHVSRDGTIAVGAEQTAMGEIAAVAWNGVSYIAYAYGRALELNRRGELIAQAPFPYIAGFDERARFFAAGRNVSILRSANGTVFRATLTNEEGHVVPATWTPIPFTIGVHETLVAASADQVGIHVAFNLMNAPYTCLLQALDFNGAPIGDPIVLEGMEGHYLETRISRAADGSIVVLRGRNRAAVVRKSRPRARDRDTDVEPEKPALLTVRDSNPHSTRATLPTLLPFPGGALIVAPLYVSYDSYSSGAIPAVTRIHADPFGISFSEPAAIEYARPVTLYATATAHGDGFLVVWQQLGARGAEIWLRKVDALGIPRDAARFLGAGFGPKIASQGDLAVVVWTNPSAPTRIEAVRVGRDGALLDSVPTAIQFTTYPSSHRALHLGSDAMQFNLIVRLDSGVATARMMASPGSAEPMTVSINPDRISFDPHSYATTSGNTILFANPWPRTNTIAAISLRHDLTPRGEARTVSILGGTTRTAWNGEHFVIAWWHRDHYRYARLSPSGEPLDTEFGRVLGEPVGVRPWGAQFEMLVRGEEFLIAVPGQAAGPPGQIASFRAGQPGKVIPLTPEATDVRALVRRADDSTLLLTADRLGQLSVRMVLP